jgi:hypothetical protein
VSADRRVVPPLDPVAIRAADDAVRGETGGRSLTMDPADAGLREKWMDAYEAAGGKTERARPRGKKVGSVKEECPNCEQAAKIKVKVSSKNSPTGSPAKYNKTPKAGSASNLFSVWPDEEFTVHIEGLPAEPPSGYIKWHQAEHDVPDDVTEFTFKWSEPRERIVTIAFPILRIVRNVVVDVPNVGTWGEELSAVTGGVGSALMLYYAEEAKKFANARYAVSPKRDAIRHAFWTSLCVSAGIPASDVLFQSTAHEYNNKSNRQQAFNTTMDLRNNRVGSTVVHTTKDGIVRAPDRNAILTELAKRYDDGEMYIYDGTTSEGQSEGVLIRSNGKKIYGF